MTGALNILLTADPFLPVPPPLYGGIERIVHALAQELRERGHCVGLVAHPDSATPVDYLRSWPSMDPRGVLNMLRHTLALQAAVKEFRPDVVHSFSRLVLMLPLLLGR